MSKPRETRLTLAIDPDTRCTGIALVDLEKVHAVGVVDVSRFAGNGRERTVAMCCSIDAALAKFPWHTFMRPGRCYVEDQQVYGTGSVDANNLTLLAKVSGAAVAACGLISRDVRLVYPREWKGSRPKGADHKATLDHYGWSYEFKGPKVPCEVTALPGDVEVIGTIPAGHMKEILDAMGLGLWGARQT